MTVEEKTQKNSDNQLFTWYKEGFLHKCYNKDAMVFAEKVKKYKVSAIHVKSVGAALLSFGISVRCLRD